MPPSSASAAHADGPEPLSPAETATVIERALLLQRTQGKAFSRPGLRGKNLGLLCEHGDSDAAMLFREAATELGARVAHVRPSLGAESPDEAIEHTARVLGRLYDAVECQGIAAPLVRKIRLGAGVPVYDGLALDTHPTSSLLVLLGNAASLAERRRWLIQAVLLSVVV